MQVGSEFLHLCQEQVHLLVRGLGASLAVVALAERPTTKKGAIALSFVPVITYPDAFNRIDSDALVAWLGELWLAETVAHQRQPYTEESLSNHQPIDLETSLSSATPSSPHSQDIEVSATPSSSTTQTTPTRTPVNQSANGLNIQDARGNKTTAIISGGGIELRSPLTFPHQDQLVVPLTYQDAMVGILVTARRDRGWNQLEQYDIQRIAQTISSACVLDQRAQWLEQRLHQQSMTYNRLQAQQKDNLADVLHQFRNPLTAIRTFGKLLRKRLQATDRNRVVADSIIRESDRLQELLQQLSTTAVLPPSLPDSDLATEALTILNGDTPVQHRESPALLACPDSFSSSTSSPAETTLSSPHAEANAINRLTGEPIQLESIAVMDILAPLMMSAQAIAQERNITLHVTCSDHLSPVWADVKALREVLNNLLDNALKYTPSGGDVHIIVGIDASESMYPGKQGIAIADTGPGIPPDDQPHLFTRHFRGVQAGSDIPGTGLGLAIAQFLVHQMQGDISVFSPVNTCPIPLNLTVEWPNGSVQSTQDPPVLWETKSNSRDDQKSHVSEDVEVEDSRPAISIESSPSNDRPGTLFIVWLANHVPTKARS